MDINSKLKDQAKKQIDEKRKEIDYDTRDYSIKYLIERFKDSELYIPYEYQRQYIWNLEDKARLIESILLGLPIPFMFFSDVDDGRCEIIDGAQRTQAIEEFYNNELQLNDLKKLDKLNGFKFDDIPEYYQKKFKNTNLRCIILLDETTIDIRQEIFKRINTGGRKANSIEIRRGSYTGNFMNFIRKCTENDTFQKICPISNTSKKRFEDLELVLRYFAYLNDYNNFNHRVDEFLDNYVDKNKIDFDEDAFMSEFEQMVSFVFKYFPFGFKKNERAKSTPRVRFEAISVGVSLALRKQPDLSPKSVDWLNSEEFKVHTTSHSSNSSKRVCGRIEYVRDCLLNGDCYE